MTRPKSRFQRIQATGARWLPTAQVCKRYDISETTLTRWVNDPSLGFPQPMKVVEGGGNFFGEDELDRFDRRRAEQARERREGKARTDVTRQREAAS